MLRNIFVSLLSKLLKGYFLEATTSLTQGDGDVNWTRQPFEQLYEECPLLILNTGGSLLRCTASGFDQWMIWNPGEVGGNALGDLPVGDWRRFVCVEPVCVNKPIVLAPDASFEGTLQIVKV